MAQRTVKFPEKLFRSALFNRETINEEARTVEISFSSEEPVERYFGIEILDHNPKSVRLDRLRTAGPILFNHDRNAHIGRVESAAIANKRGSAVVRFSKSALGNEKFQDVKDGILREVSVGYGYYKAVLEEERDGVSTFRITDWEPLEISFVTIPADISVGAGRDRANITTTEIELPVGEITTRTQPNSKMDPVTTPVTTPVVTVPSATVVAETRNAETTRIRELSALGTQFADRGVTQDEVSSYIRDGKSVDDFRAYILTEKFKAQPVTRANPEIGMSKKDKRQYRLVRAIGSLANNRALDGLEKEASDATAKAIGRDASGFFIPHDMYISNDPEMARALERCRPPGAHSSRGLSASVAADGGYTVQTDVLGGSMIELLRNRAMLSQLGVRTLSGLQGNISIPRVTGGATAYWLAEGGTVTGSKQAFGQLGLTPKALMAQTGFTKQLLAQSSIDVEAFVRDDLMTVLALEKDRAGINGAGGAEPTGIINTPSLATAITFGGAPTWQDVVDFETNIATANADVAAMNFLSTPAVRGKWKTTVKVSGYPVFLLEGNLANGYNFNATNQVPSNKVIFGNFADAFFGDWAGLDITVDPYSQAASGQIIVTVLLHTDFGVRHAKSFCVSTDSGAQ